MPVPSEVEPSPGTYQCVACGACCAAPDITALAKPLGVPCKNLGPDMLCGIYEARPQVCRSYRPDWVCAEVAPLPTLEARVQRFLEIYGLWEEYQGTPQPTDPGILGACPKTTSSNTIWPSV